MRRIFWVPLFLLTGVIGINPMLGQVKDMRPLIGKKAVAQRMPFYVPGTYQAISNTYAGQTVTIIDVKPSALYASMPRLTPAQLATLPPQSRQSIENVRWAATIVVQFPDGTKAVTGAAPVMPSMLGSYLELLPGQEGPSAPPLSSALPIENSQVASPAPMGLTDDQVRSAIDRALRGKRHAIGITLNDVETSLLSGIVCSTCQTSGYTIQVYTPEQWIEKSALDAQREMLPFSLADVPSEMRMPYLHVVALPSTAEYINGSGLAMASSVHRVVLSSTDRAETIQPIQNENGVLNGNSAFRSVVYTSASAIFPMSDVCRLRSLDKNREFFIVVVGDNQNKFFKVKSRFFRDLFGEASH